MTKLITEQEMENKLMKQLVTLGYEKIKVTNEQELIANFKTQLEKHNETIFSEDEFKQILNELNKGSVFDKAEQLRDRILVNRDDGTQINIPLLDTKDWCKNIFQVTHQITMEGTYTNRYDVTLLINGLPLVQIELKRSGIELKEAFNQTGRYGKHSYGAGQGLFQYIQIFVISNGTLTKYYANPGTSMQNRNFEQTFYWTDKANRPIQRLQDFTNHFLEKCHISKMITRYTVLNQAQRILMVLRPYQYYAVEEMVVHVLNSNKNGYIWHTTGSGKTLTSFMASRLIQNMEEITKVVFVVDRRDLDSQTTEEFNKFSKGCVSGTTNTRELVKQFNDPNSKLIVTTLQKLNNAVTGNRYAGVMNQYSDKKIVFIFDECHRSQFGETHKNIVRFFPKSQLFGFTGTPIFHENAQTQVGDMRTTNDLFDTCLHKYLITDAIKDENVLKFSIEYYSTFKQKESINDEDVEEINRAEVYEAPERLEQVADFIIKNHNRKTHDRQYTAFFAISNVPTLIKYFDLFLEKKEKGEHNLRIATIFSFGANEDGTLGDNDEGDEYVHTREKLDQYIEYYNKEYGGNYNTRDSYYSYYENISKQVVKGNIDILFVVNMFLTGFDSRKLNTLYVDKNLRYHGLIQAFSRTNRIETARKSQGNIVCFRNLKEATDTAIELFADKDATDTIIIPPYEEFIERFKLALEDLHKITPTPDSVIDLIDEEEEAQFVQAFRSLLRIMNQLKCYSEFSFNDLAINQTTFADYTSQYHAIKDKVEKDRDAKKVSILSDLDFELELLAHNEVNVNYILRLLTQLKTDTLSEQEKIRQKVQQLLNSEPQLRSKRELIEKFMNEILPNIESEDTVEENFFSFWEVEKRKAQRKISEQENLDHDKLHDLINNYLYSGIKPLSDDVISTMHERPRLLELESRSQSVISKIKDFIDTFVTGV